MAMGPSELVRQLVHEPVDADTGARVNRRAIHDIAHRDVVSGAGLAIEAERKLKLAGRSAGTDCPREKTDSREDVVCIGHRRRARPDTGMNAEVAILEHADVSAG